MKRYVFITYIVFFLAGKADAQKDIRYVSGSSEKIEQLVGDWDNQLDQPTENQTNSRFGVHATDLGVPFEHKGKTYVAFGDIPPPTYDRDPLAFTEDTNPEDGLHLDFVTNPDGNHRPIDIPGVALKGFEVPMEGVSWNDVMYIYATTDRMGRSVLAKSTDDGYTFTKLYDLSDSKFINVSLVKTTSTDEYPEPPSTDIQVMVGSGMYRQSSVYLAYQRADAIEEKSLNYLSGFTDEGGPEWSSSEANAAPVFSHPCVGELSLSYNGFIDQWILLYNCENPRGINCRVADNPWGPWSDPFVIFDPFEDNGYCHFIHSNWEVNQCDDVHDPGRENEWGGEYGPYQFEHMAKGDSSETTIYYTLSTWNPYTVVLMKSTLRRHDPSALSISNDVNYDLSCYPNPVKDRLTLTFNSPDRGEAAVEIRDILGRIHTGKHLAVKEGKNRYELATAGLSAGVYFLKVRLPGTTKIITRKLLVE